MLGSAVVDNGRNSGALLQTSHQGLPIWGWCLLMSACPVPCRELPEDDDCPGRLGRIRRRPPGRERIRWTTLMLRSAASFIAMMVRAAV